MKLSETQAAAFELVKKHGRICRYRGGYWNAPGMKAPDYETGSFGTNTVFALYKKRLVSISEERGNANGIFTIEYELSPRLKK